MKQITIDVGIEGEVVRLFKLVDDELGPLTVLVNNARILEKQCRVTRDTQIATVACDRDSCRETYESLHAARARLAYLDNFIHILAAAELETPTVPARHPIRLGSLADS